METAMEAVQPQQQQSSTAAQRVQAITELLEHILQALSLPTLLSSAQRTCRRWQDVVQHLIKTNVDIRKRLFLTPATLEEIENLQRDFHDAECAIYVEHENSCSLANPYLDLTRCDFEVCVAGRTICAAARDGSGDLRHSMYFTQPPLGGVGIIIEADERPPSARLFIGVPAALWWRPAELHQAGAATVAQIVGMTERFAAERSTTLDWEATKAWIYGYSEGRVSLLQP